MTESTVFPLLLLYGTQTGNAEAIAKEVYAELHRRFRSESITLSSMQAFAKQDDTLKSLQDFRAIVAVMSTTGQGDAPDNAAKFLRALRKHVLATPPLLANTLTTVLALGDTNYSNFCKPGIRLDADMDKLGATRLLPLAKADDGVGLEQVVEPWKTSLYQKFTEIQQREKPQSVTVTVSAASKQSEHRPSATAMAILQAQQKIRALTLARSGLTPTADSDTLADTNANAITNSTDSSNESDTAIIQSTLSPSLILYATQTGNSEGIARELHSLWQAQYPNTATLSSMAQFLNTNNNTIDNLANYRVIVTVISSTGQGDPPDNAMKFLRMLKKGSDGSSVWLSSVRYAVLGLGDTNYDSFGAVPMRVDRDLGRGGAVKLLTREIADDAVGLDIVVEPYKQKLLKAIRLLVDEAKAKSQTQSISVPKPAPAKGVVDDSDERKESSSQLSISNNQSSTAFINAVPMPVDDSKAPCDMNSPTDAESSPVDDPSLIKPKNKVFKPVGLARFHPCRVSARVTAAAPSHSQLQSITDSYFSRRWSNMDVESVLKGYTPEAPFFARVADARYLTTDKAHSEGRRVIHIELELPHSGTDSVNYTPGDSIGVYCVNSQSLVTRLLARLSLTGDDSVEVKVREESIVTEVLVHDRQVIDTPAPSSAARESTASPLPTPLYSTNANASTALSSFPRHNTTQSSVGLPHINSPCTISDLFFYCLDLTAPPKKTMLRMLAEYCRAADDKAALFHLASHGGKKDYDALLVSQCYGLLDLLERFPSCHPPLAYLIDHLPALQPRYYSITSSPLVHAATLHIAFTVVDRGVCTNWLSQVAQHSGRLLDDPLFTARQGEALMGVHAPPPSPSQSLFIPVFMRRTHTFTLPQSLDVPLIFIGPGTGVAPFRSFLYHRRQQRLALESGGTAMGAWRGMDVNIEEMEEEQPQPGYVNRFQSQHAIKRAQCKSVSSDRLQQSLLSASPSTELARAPLPSHSDLGVSTVTMFYGCRAPDVDFLYCADFDSFLGDSTLNTLSLAFSRTQTEKVYVQHRIEQHSAELFALIERGAVIYVCGDGARMAKSVMQAFADVVQRESGRSTVEAMKFVAELMQSKRYVQDIWSN